jgi:hypothetical protein
MRFGNLTHKKITEWLQEGESKADEIRNKLGIDASITLPNLYNLILNDLKEMEIDIVYDYDNDDNALFNKASHQSVPSIAMDDVILLNQNFSREAQCEALFHEYIHVKLNDELEGMKEILGKNAKLSNLEYSVDFTNYMLIMPPEILKKNLLRFFDKESKSIRMNQVLKLYKDFEKCSVLHWISIHSQIACHFSWLMIYGENNKPLIYESYYYDHKNDPKHYNITEVMNIPLSATSQAIKKKKDTTNKESLVGTNKYQCYAYYEKDLIGKKP